MLTNGVVAAAAIITGTDLSSQCMTDLEPPDKQADAQLALWWLAPNHHCRDITRRVPIRDITNYAGFGATKPIQEGCP
uniref:Uncharacterized protein n=1 Tax=Oryza glumipatula TaxID=40148 RepID=A0A0D9ZHQ9_9ORYZ